MGSPFGFRLIALYGDQMRRAEGYAYTYQLPPDVPSGDNEEAPWRSLVHLFEDGVELGPAHVAHEEIRALGKGRFSHWRSAIWFATSDNSSPFTNGRQYSLLIPGAMYVNDTNLAVYWEAMRRIHANEMSTLERFGLARSLYWSVWPHSRLPDIGRRIDGDQDFAKEFARVSPEADYSYERKYNLNQLFPLVRRVDGDVAECGTYKGGSAAFLGRHIVAHGLSKRLCLFDSFAGLSAPTEIDGEWWHQGDLSGTIGDVQQALAPLGDLSFVEIFQGWIPDRFGEVADRRFSFVHIDVDLFAPTLDSISFFYPRLNRGAIILLDDYGYESCVGATAAVDQFMRDKPEPIVNFASGGAFILKE